MLAQGLSAHKPLVAMPPYTDEEHQEMGKYLATNPSGCRSQIWQRFQRMVCFHIHIFSSMAWIKMCAIFSTPIALIMHGKRIMRTTKK